MSDAIFKTNTAAFLYDELQCKVSARTLSFICNAVDAASLDAQLKDYNKFPRRVATVSLAEFIKTDFRDSCRHYTVDLFDKHFVPIGSIRIYLDGGCRLLGDSSDEAMLAYKARIGLL